MAHIEKFKQGGINGLFLHNGREAGDGHTHSNEEIDSSRTHLNYDLCGRDGTLSQRFRVRLGQVHCMKRDDVNVLDSLVVHLPENIRAGDERKFFEACYAFACGDFGEKNIVGGNVHRDEKREHIHISFIPVIEGKRRNGEPVEKVCHDKLITRDYYKQLHERLSDFVAEQLGYKVSILNGATAGGNKTVQELKAQSLAEKNAKAEEKLSATQKKALEYEQPPKKALERQQSYEDRVATGQQAVAVRQRTADLDAREADLQRRQSDFDAEVTRKATEIAKSTITKREHDEIIRRKQAEAERDKAIRSLDEAVRQATEPLRKDNRNLRELLEDTVEQYTGQLITADELLEHKQRAEEQIQNQNRNLYRRGR